MFKLEVESEQFRGLSLVKQHKLVTGILKKEIGDMVRVVSQ
jgi:stress-induced morphogen